MSFKSRGTSGAGASDWASAVGSSLLEVLLPVAGKLTLTVVRFATALPLFLQIALIASATCWCAEVISAGLIGEGVRLTQT